jgi:CelD/BcsL family acetyltransferase involved in cellulose biosynthesis
MTVFTLDPLRDPRWSELVARHPNASVFHSTAWLRALQRTYEYQPIVFTASAPGTTLDNGIVFCGVRSWLTGRRLVSLPFSDHCEPLVAREQFEAISAHVKSIGDQWDYVEYRPLTDRFTTAGNTHPTDGFWFHQLDLRPNEGVLFAAFHRTAIQQPIHRAEREGLAYDERGGEEGLGDFYQLLLLTRQRHQLPPQPLAWFRNLAHEFGAAMKIRVARQGGRAIAAIVTLRHREVMVYKYAASDAKCHSLGGTQLLVWKTIQDAISTGCTTLDLGRSDADNDGLIAFKDRWGARRFRSAYLRHGEKAASHGAIRAHAMTGVRKVLDHVPQACRVAAGRFLYRHAG